MYPFIDELSIHLISGIGAVSLGQKAIFKMEECADIIISDRFGAATMPAFQYFSSSHRDGFGAFHCEDYIMNNYSHDLYTINAFLIFYSAFKTHLILLNQ